MNANLKAFTLVAILIAGTGMTPAFGQTLDPIMVTTDKESYSDGETIMVTGEVSQLLAGYQVSLQVKSPNGSVVTVDQISVGEDMKFSTELTAGGLLKAEGTYTIKVLYGNQRMAETTFTFDGSTGTGVDPPPPPADRSSIVISDEYEAISFSITGGTVISMEPDVESKSLIIAIDATEDGSLTLTIPREVMDALDADGITDEDYFVLVDREQADDFTETKTSTHRTLTIEFPAGTEEIEIIGTFIIPEFGTIAAMILAVAIISIIAVSARSRLSIMPRY